MLYLAIAISLLGHQPLWLDEIWQQLGTRNVGFHQMVAYARNGAGGALLVHFLQWCILKAFPYSAAVSRIPAFSFGAGSVVLSWCLARQLRLKYPAVVGALFMALPILFRYTLEARPYSEGVFFVGWGLLLLFQLDEQPTVLGSLALLLVAAAGLYSQPFVLFELLTVAAFLAATRWKNAWYLLLPMLGAVLLYLPWYLSASKQWNDGLSASTGVTVFDAKLPLRVLREYTGGGYVVGLCFLLLVVWGFRAGGNQRLKYILAAGFVAGLLIPLLADQQLQYFYAARHLIFALPAGAMLCALAFETAATTRAQIVLGILLIAAVTTIVAKQAGPHEDWRSASEYLAALTKKGDCVESVRPDGMVYYRFFAPWLGNANCLAEKKKRVVLIADPYSPANLLTARSQQFMNGGYEEARSEKVNDFQLVYFLLRGDQSFTNGK